MKVLGYHGTTMNCVERIQEVGFKKSTRASLWMGSGVYFFQDAPARAYDWAEFISERRGGIKSAVIRAEIDLTDCIDLVDAKWWSFLRYSCKKVESKWRSVEAQISPIEAFRDPTLEGIGKNYVDCAVMNEFFRMLRGKAGVPCPRSVRCPFMEGRPIHPTSWLYDRASVIINVVDPSAIKTWDVV